MAKSKKMQPISNTRSRAENLRKLQARGNAHRTKKNNFTSSEKKEWKDAICSVCMEYPHNAVLLLCSSYEKGCRPYMCATSNRYSNCLKQYKKAYKNVSNFPEESKSFSSKTRDPELVCPLCRGQVKGSTVVERARGYLNAKKRACTQDNCPFTGNYGQLRRHVRLHHHLSRPRAVDPTRAEKWKKLESERELNDVYSTIRSTMPGGIVVGDYVIERSDDRAFLIPRWGGSGFSSDEGYTSLEEEYERHWARRVAGRGYFAATRGGRLRIRR